MKKNLLTIVLFIGLPIVVGVIIYNAIFKTSNQTTLPAVSSAISSSSVSTPKSTSVGQTQVSTAKSVKSTKVS